MVQTGIDFSNNFSVNINEKQGKIRVENLLRKANTKYRYFQCKPRNFCCRFLFSCLLVKFVSDIILRGLSQWL